MSSFKGIGVPAVLLVIFIVLKLLKLINWSWWWVLSPLWITVAILFFAVIVVAVFGWRFNRKN